MRYDEQNPERYVCYYFHASPGIGKTYLFNQVCLKNKDDIPNIYARTNFQDKVQFIGITFNSKTMYNELAEKDLSCSDIFWSRVIYAEFIDHSVSWNDFLEVYIIMKKDRAILSDVFFQMLINKYKSKEIFVFLIDEITKITIKQQMDSVRSYICQLQDQNEPIKALSIFSTLNPDIIHEKITHESLRSVKAITQLNLF